MAIYKGNFPVNFTGGLFKEDIKNNLLFLGNDLIYNSQIPLVTFMSASGGTESIEGDFRIHKFTSTGNLDVHSLGTFDPGAYVYLILAGGGGGSGGQAGSHYGGGGAGGTARTGSQTLVATGIFTATVGAGGLGKGLNVAGDPGTNSSFNTITANGGGGGLTGAGGANADFTGAARSGISGGGGAGAGQNGVGGGSGGNGGNGIQSAISGSSIFYGGGGGGGIFPTGSGNGGAGGGGTGNADAPGGSAGVANFGGGGGGTGNNRSGGDGGSGIVFVRYQFQ